ncbi:MAG: rhomboid family intramembrane serine protease, partial [Planctomycetes bacterium]|nr:rhomboid family intramembrane serine protease [Planctomycetota bacterium]
WRLLTAMLLHHTGSWIHLVANALSLFFVGRAVERACGRTVLLAAVVGGALAGSAASLVWIPDPGFARVGISGGIAALLGLLHAVEWADSRSFLGFLKQRNTILVLVFLALGYVLAEHVFTWLAVDHVAHAGGLAFGLLSGLAYETRKGLRPARGAAVALALSVLPVAYASHPLLEPEYRVFRARRAILAEDFETAARELDRASEIDPGALDRGGLRDDLLDAYLRVAARRLGTSEGETLLGKALALGGRKPDPWIAFANAAEQGGHADAAYEAWREAAALLRDGDAWLAFERALRLLRRREAPPVRETIEMARGAARGLRAGLPPEAATELEREIARAAEALHGRGDPPEGDDARALSELYRTLAENAGADARRPRYRLRSAEWLWRGSGEASGDVVARFGAAITEAALYGDPAAGEEAAKWFRERGMAVPEPDLEGEEGGG